MFHVFFSPVKNNYRRYLLKNIYWTNNDAKIFNINNNKIAENKYSKIINYDENDRNLKVLNYNKVSLTSIIHN